MSLGMGTPKKKIQFLFQEQRRTGIRVLNCRIWVEVRSCEFSHCSHGDTETGTVCQWVAWWPCSLCLFLWSWLKLQGRKSLLVLMSHRWTVFSPRISILMLSEKGIGKIQVFWKHSQGGHSGKVLGLFLCWWGMVRAELLRNAWRAEEAWLKITCFLITMFVFLLVWHQCPTLIHLVKLEVSIH